MRRNKYLDDLGIKRKNYKVILQKRTRFKDFLNAGNMVLITEKL